MVPDRPPAMVAAQCDEEPGNVQHVFGIVKRRNVFLVLELARSWAHRRTFISADEGLRCRISDCRHCAMSDLCRGLFLAFPFGYRLALPTTRR